MGSCKYPYKKLLANTRNQISVGEGVAGRAAAPLVGQKSARFGQFS